MSEDSSRTNQKIPTQQPATEVSISLLNFSDGQCGGILTPPRDELTVLLEAMATKNAGRRCLAPANSDEVMEIFLSL